MELKKAFELQVKYYGNDGTVKVDDNGYLCLNDLAEFFPNKRIQHWLDNDSTKEFISYVGKLLINPVSGELKPAVIAKKGRYNSGTFAHELIAMDFAAWLSVEFRVHIYQSYINGTQRKENWNIKRILAANNYRLMTDAIKNDHEVTKPYHYSNEALMLNEIVFGIREGNVRETATEEQLDFIATLESYNAGYIEAGIEYAQRKDILKSIVAKKNAKTLPVL